jgi:hypothetical protein
MKLLGASWRLPIAIGTLLTCGYGQAVVQRGEEIFVISVHWTSGLNFRGSYLATTAASESKSDKIQGTVPAEFTVVGTGMYLTLQKLSEPGQIEVEISKNGGATVKRQRTDAPYGVVGLATATPQGGPPKPTEFEVNGSSKFAFLTVMYGTGDTEQQRVTLPFTKSFFPKEGWIVGVTAQKFRVTRPDPVSIQGRIEVLDDGVSGSVHVAIHVNGRILGESESSEPHGVASATVRIP